MREYYLTGVSQEALVGLQILAMRHLGAGEGSESNEEEPSGRYILWQKGEGPCLTVYLDSCIVHATRHDPDSPIGRMLHELEGTQNQLPTPDLTSRPAIR